MLNHFELIRIFCCAADSLSFKQAAAQLGKSPQTVTRAIKELEALRGEILFYRSTRNIRITAAGEALAIQAREALKNIDSIVSAGNSDSQKSPSGNIRLTLPMSLGRRLVMPALTAFQEKYPEVTLTCMLTDSHSDMVDEKIDIGLRTGFVRDNRFISRLVRDVDFLTIGAPELIKKVGAPQNMTELSGMPLVALLDRGTGRYWPWGYEHASTFIPPAPRFVTDDLDAYCDAVLSGVGFGYIADYLAKPLIDADKLIQIMPNTKSTKWGLYLYRPQTGPVPPRIRLMYDHLLNFLSSFNI